MITPRVVADVVGVEGLPQALGQVLRQIADALVSIRRPGDDALNIDLITEAEHVQRFRLVVLVKLVERLVPSGQQLPRDRVEVVA